MRLLVVFILGLLLVRDGREGDGEEGGVAAVVIVDVELDPVRAVLEGQLSGMKALLAVTKLRVSAGRPEPIPFSILKA